FGILSAGKYMKQSAATAAGDGNLGREGRPECRRGTALRQRVAARFLTRGELGAFVLGDFDRA
ncbi:MAG TPA: hypothetical protein VJB99_03135, partial [Patescibacteria group bacterium]|nr:hypothetical protein [Patescibacteria group bacterium]